MGLRGGTLVGTGHTIPVLTEERLTSAVTRHSEDTRSMPGRRRPATKVPRILLERGPTVGASSEA